jgi:NAD(P)-dependent dehydrogenase (short-subunit alcohol dehydrogenase family)
MDLGIRGRTAIVCASSQGLGKACARALAEAGVSLVINGRNRTLLDQTAEEIRQATGTATEFGQTCAFLCSVHAAYITGQNILLDGGAYPAAF